MYKGEDMKRLLILLLLLFVALVASAQEVHGKAEIGVFTSAIQIDNPVIGDYVYDFKEYIPYVDLDVYLDLEFIKVGGGVLTLMLDSQEVNFYPVFSEYSFYTEAYWDIFTLGWKHNCYHEVVGNTIVGTLFNKGGGFNSIYIKAEF